MTVGRGFIITVYNPEYYDKLCDLWIELMEKKRFIETEELDGEIFKYEKCRIQLACDRVNSFRIRRWLKRTPLLSVYCKD